MPKLFRGLKILMNKIDFLKLFIKAHACDGIRIRIYFKAVYEVKNAWRIRRLGEGESSYIKG